VPGFSDEWDAEMSMKILVVDDEISIVEALTYNLEHHGYQVASAQDGEKAIELARRFLPDLIILDIMLPGIDGFEVCRQLRRDFDRVSIFFLSARDDEFDRVIGLEIGADDYISKPFSTRELLARIKAHFRSIQWIQEETETAAAHKARVTFGNLTIDTDRREVKVNGVPVEVKPKEFDLLVFFTENKGRVFSRENIMKNVWGWDFPAESRTVDVHVRWLREKIEPNPNRPVRIITFRNVGYRFDG
jgi:DNA-binding response OmpR family regulator